MSLKISQAHPLWRKLGTHKPNQYGVIIASFEGLLCWAIAVAMLFL